jgi:hypothetical protein
LRLAATSVEILSRLDPRTDRMISFDQPFGEYLARGAYDFGPLQFAETLVRGDLPVTQLGLEMNLSSHADATPHRDILALHARLDRWACLGLPLVILLTCPSPSTQPLAATPDDASRRESADEEAIKCDVVEAAGIELLLHTFASRHDVQAVFWNAWGDQPDARPPQYGVFDQRGVPRESLAAIRRATAVRSGA